MSNRFSYVRYDEHSTQVQQQAKRLCEDLEAFIYSLGNRIEQLSRPQSHAFTALEEVYMWIGKAIRDNQIERTGKVDEQPERGNE